MIDGLVASSYVDADSVVVVWWCARLFAVDLYGSGPDEPEIRKAALERNLTLRFHGAIDHAKLTNYKVRQTPRTEEEEGGVL